MSIRSLLCFAHSSLYIGGGGGGGGRGNEGPASVYGPHAKAVTTLNNSLENQGAVLVVCQLMSCYYLNETYCHRVNSVVACDC